MPEAVKYPTIQAVHDPVCHTNFEAVDRAGSIEHEGLTYYFCSEACMRAFEADPNAILLAEGHEHSARHQR